jgi:hypothetical protein
MGMVAEDPVRLVDGRRASCDGGEYFCLEEGEKKKKGGKEVS